MQKYNSIFTPFTYQTSDGKKELWTPSYFEVGTQCCQYPGLEGDANAILVYSTILAFTYNQNYEPLRLEKKIPIGKRGDGIDTYFINMNYLSRFLNLTYNEVEYSIIKLKDLKILSILEYLPNSDTAYLIKINEDLRYNSKCSKDAFKVYDRIFFYPAITTKMALLYSFYLHSSKTLSAQKYNSFKYMKATSDFGYTKKEIISTQDALKNAGLIEIVGQPKYNIVLPIVDFAKMQPEEYTLDIDKFVA